MTESKDREKEMIYEGTEAEHVAKCRETLAFLDKNLASLTPRHFTKSHIKELRELISVWRWYLSHSYFKAPHDDLNTPDTKPPIQYLYNALFEGPRNVPAMVTLCAAPGVKESMNLRMGAEYLMYSMRKVLHYQTPKEIPKTFYLPIGHPDKTDQEGVPFERSDSDAAKNWRKRRENEQKAREETMAPKVPYQKTDEELKAYLKAKEERREFERRKREQISEEQNAKIKAAKLKERRKNWR